MDIFESITNGIVSAGAIILLGVILASWLASYRRPKARPVRSGDWFFTLPTWAQIVGGVGACVLFAYLGYLLWLPLPLTVSPLVSWILQVAGLVLFLAGWLLVLWARWALGAMYGVSTSFAAPLRAQHRLIQHGPYAFVRHPMYLGYWLLLLGITLVYRAWTPLLLLVICLASFYRRARREEQVLAETFGVEWQGYKARTKFLIPWVY